MQLQREEQASYPTLQSIQGIRGICIEAGLRVRDVLMHNVDKLLKKNVVTREGSDARTNQKMAN